jgi:hypothetical protein
MGGVINIVHALRLAMEVTEHTKLDDFVSAYSVRIINGELIVDGLVSSFGGAYWDPIRNAWYLCMTDEAW